jgi:hypothetical protein
MLRPTWEMEVTERKDARRRITESLLIERLGLNGEWADPDNLPKSLPTELTGSIAEQLSRSDRMEIERELDRLVEIGCCRGVLYFCLLQMGVEQDQLRAGSEWKTPTEDEPQFPPIRLHRDMAAQKDDMDPLANQVKATAKAITTWRRELLLSADALGTECDLPHGFLDDGPPNAVEALATLQSSLLWVRRLAEFWEAPYEAAAVKTKGILFLLAYVAIFGHRPPKQSRQRPQADCQVERLPAKLTKREAGVLSRLANLYCQEVVEPHVLSDRLVTFRADYPRLFMSLTSLLACLHSLAKPASPTGKLPDDCQATHPPANCCAKMKSNVAGVDAAIRYSSILQEYSIHMPDESDSVVQIKFCPWCGSELPVCLPDV